MAISVIIPIAKGDEAWRELVVDLHVLRKDDEVIFVLSHSPDVSMETDAVFNGLRCPYQFLISAPGRAKQLNWGARHAQNSDLWFLHCDSRISQSALVSLRASLAKSPEALHFFDLKFQGDGPALVQINGIGTWFRSRILRLPFGDQGFCVSKFVFQRLGGFDESAIYGEDHLFVWKAHRLAVKLRAVGLPLYTSARKYQKFGWGKTTARHLYLTVRQAWPELLEFVRARVHV